MADRKSVMHSLKDSLKNLHCGFVEGIGNVYAVSEETINNAIALLKEQETENLYKCPNCGTWVSAKNIVRCNDCKHAELCEIYAGWDGKHPDWFCADGERREVK